MNIWTENALNKFLTYVKIDTQSDEESSTSPSSMKQYDLLNLLQKELNALGIPSEMDEYGRLYAKIPGKDGLPTIGLNSHVDTALECSGFNVRPKIIKNYQGEVIQLNKNYSMSPKEFPILMEHIGDTLVTTSGDTLLGGDDKAGVALIMNLAEFLVKNPTISHYPIAILFTPDEEIGRGPEHFNKEKFGADFAYTVDGDYPLAIDYENFNAAKGDITIEGVAIHPGEAKGKLINALTLAEEIDASLPKNERPENTSLREGFFHLTEIKGTSSSCFMNYIIREHNKEKFIQRKELLEKIVKKIQRKYPKAKISLLINDQYRNMEEVVLKDPQVIEHAKEAFKKLNLIPSHNPVRGGTDGATFTFLGVPCPNLGTGSYNHHGRYEFLSLRDFDLMRQILEALICL